MDKKQIKLKDVPITTLDGVPLKVGNRVYAVDIREPYREPMRLEILEYSVEYVNTSGRTYMVKELSKGIEYKFSCKCWYYSSIDAAKKSLKREVKEKISTIEQKVKLHNKNLKFLKGLL